MTATEIARMAEGPNLMKRFPILQKPVGEKKLFLLRRENNDQW